MTVAFALQLWCRKWKQRIKNAVRDGHLFDLSCPKSYYYVLYCIVVRPNGAAQ